MEKIGPGRPVDIPRKKDAFRVWLPAYDRLDKLMGHGFKKVDIVNAGIHVMFEFYEISSETLEATIREAKAEARKESQWR